MSRRVECQTMEGTDDWEVERVAAARSASACLRSGYGVSMVATMLALSLVHGCSAVVEPGAYDRDASNTALLTLSDPPVGHPVRP